MLRLPPSIRVFLCLVPVDMRRSFDGLAAAAEQVVRQDPLSGHLFVFRGRRDGRTAAILYSVIQSAKRHQLDPFRYLRDLFLRIPSHPNKEIHRLLPGHWKREILPTLDTPPRP